MPDFIRAYGEPLPDQGWEEFIDSRYFSPEAKHYMREALAHQAKGVRLSADDHECLRRIWVAVVESGRNATSAQEDRFQLKQEFDAFERRMWEAFTCEMRKRDPQYGPDYYLPDDVEIPSPQELAFSAEAARRGVSYGSIKSWYYRARDRVGTR